MRMSLRPTPHSFPQPLHRLHRLHFAAAFLLAGGLVAGSVAAAVPAAYAAPVGTQCRTEVHGSTGTATCHNPDPTSVSVQLHIQCRRWWDPAVDTGRISVGPAQTVTLSDRCWKEIGSLWVTRR